MQKPTVYIGKCALVHNKHQCTVSDRNMSKETLYSPKVLTWTCVKQNIVQNEMCQRIHVKNQPFVQYDTSEHGSVYNKSFVWYGTCQPQEVYDKHFYSMTSRKVNTLQNIMYSRQMSTWTRLLKSFVQCDTCQRGHFYYKVS